MNTTEGTLGSQAITTDLLWGRRKQSTRGPRPTLSVDDIAQTAVRIADTDGLAAVSMQRVARELDFTKMALYRYVSSKAELLAVMIEAAAGEPPDLHSVEGGWRAKLEEFARLLAIVWERHPWLPWITIGDRVMGPREVGWTDAALSALDGTGLDGAAKMDAVFVLFGHIRNTQSTTTAGTQAWTADESAATAMQHALADHEGEFPALTAVMASTSEPSRDNGRAFGLRLFLDGLEAQLGGRSRRRHS